MNILGHYPDRRRIYSVGCEYLEDLGGIYGSTHKRDHVIVLAYEMLEASELAVAYFQGRHGLSDVCVFKVEHLNAAAIINENSQPEAPE